MKGLYIEGVAIRGGPESCVGVREGVGEASVAARAGRAMEPRNHRVRGADVVHENGRPHRQQRFRELLTDPARSENHCMYGTSLRENREISEVARRDGVAAGRVGKAKAMSRR